MPDQRALYTEDAVGLNHPTKGDVINRVWGGVGINCFRLILSGGNLTLAPVTGWLVDINDALHKYTVMPTLAAAGLTPGVVYYIYLYDNAGTAALEASATGYTVDTKGRAYKTGDATRRLMGMAQPLAGPAWADTITNRLVRSYGARAPVNLSNALSTDRTTASAPWVEINSEIRCEFLIWADEIADFRVTAQASHSTGAGTYASIAFDGTTRASTAGSVLHTLTNLAPLAVTTAEQLAEGYHYVTLIGGSASGTATYSYGANGQTRMNGILHPGAR